MLVNSIRSATEVLWALPQWADAVPPRASRGLIGDGPVDTLGSSIAQDGIGGRASALRLHLHSSPSFSKQSRGGRTQLPGGGVEAPNIPRPPPSNDQQQLGGLGPPP